VMVSQISDHRRLMLETRTEQDVRAVAELMLRELRLAGSWGRPDLGTWSEANPNPIANPYEQITISADGTKIEFSTSFAADNPGSSEDNIINNSEKRGFVLADGVLKSLSGGNSQPLTDPETLRITRFLVSLQPSSFSMASICAKPCDGLANCPPKTTVRDVRIVHDESVKRNLDVTVRLQADKVEGVCNT
jgi:hypothetical protein